MSTCFDRSRCVGLLDHGASSSARRQALIFVGDERAQSADLRRLPACLRASFNSSLSASASSACVVWPTVNLNCMFDQCDRRTAALLRASVGWNSSGRNHLIYDHIDAPRTPFDTGLAILLKTAMRAADYRPGFDVPYPLPPQGIHQVRHRADSSPRPLLLSFKGSCRHNRAKYANWHDGVGIVIVCTDRPRMKSRGKLKTDNYHELALRSRFALTPAGNGLHSARLMEALFLGAIPVVAEDQLLLPFCSIVDWETFSVRLPAERWQEIPSVLRAISQEKLKEMQQALAQARAAFFQNPMQTAVSLVVRRVLDAS